MGKKPLFTISDVYQPSKQKDTLIIHTADLQYNCNWKTQVLRTPDSLVTHIEMILFSGGNNQFTALLTSHLTQPQPQPQPQQRGAGAIVKLFLIRKKKKEKKNDSRFHYKLRSCFPRSFHVHPLSLPSLLFSRTDARPSITKKVFNICKPTAQYCTVQYSRISRVSLFRNRVMLLMFHYLTFTNTCDR